MVRIGDAYKAVVVYALVLSAGDLVAQQVRDSAGIRIVTYARNDTPRQRWSLDPTPLLEIGGRADEGPTAFAGISGAVRLSDGRIAVASVRPSEIRMFSPAGAYIRSLGRNGQGPGEFNQHLFRLVRSNDSLIGIDNTMRAQLFDPNGELRRSLSRPRPPGAGANPARIAFGPRGNAIVQGLELTAQPISAGEMHFVKLFNESPDAADYAELLRAPAYRATGNQPPAAQFLVYGAAGRFAANGDRVCVGFSSEFEIACYDHAGRMRLVVRRAVTPRAISDDDRRFFRDMLLSGVKGAPTNVIAMVEESARRTEFADRAPAFGRLALSPTSDIWISEFDRSEQAVGAAPLRTTQVSLRWSVFGNDGTWLSDIELPARFTPYEMGTDYVLGVTLDQDDVERITLYRIRR